MQTRAEFQLAIWLGTLSAILLAASTSLADVAILNGGGVVHGKVNAASGSITVRIRTGGLIVLEQDAVKQIDGDPHSKKKSPSQKLTAGRSAKSQLTAKEQAWLPKVHALVARLFSENPDQSRRARMDLLQIADPDAIAGLNRFLRSLPSEPGRRLYVAILRAIPGPEPTGYLVVQSLYDPSSRVRAEARRAIGPQRADAAREMYIECLRMSDEPNLLSFAAQGIGEVGDSRGEAVPYLIESLVQHGTQTLVVPGTIQQFGDCIDEQNEAARPKLVCVSRSEGRSEVLEALLKITDQTYPKYGYNVELWRAWWTQEGKRAHSETAAFRDRRER